MIHKNTLVAAIIKGIQEKKGQQITVIDLIGVDGAICQYMVVCQGNSPTHVSAVCDQVWDTVRIDEGEKPISIDGQNNAQWVAMDYGNVVAHIFLPEQRDYYDLAHLWADAHIENIADIN